jgi:hypothetical protein
MAIGGGVAVPGVVEGDRVLRGFCGQVLTAEEEKEEGAECKAGSVES